jgi:hypothetical protein
VQGKFFYSCTFPAEQRCNFFMWAEVRSFSLLSMLISAYLYCCLLFFSFQDSPELLKQAVCLPSAGTASQDPADLHAQAQREKMDYTARAYSSKLRAMNRDELKNEVLSLNRRSQLSGCTTKLSITGTKEEMVERLLKEAIKSLREQGEGGVSDDDGSDESDSEPRPAPVRKQKAPSGRRSGNAAAASSSVMEEVAAAPRSTARRQNADDPRAGAHCASGQKRTAVSAAPEPMDLSDDEDEEDGESSAEEQADAQDARDDDGDEVASAEDAMPDAPELDGDDSGSEGIFSDEASAVDATGEIDFGTSDDDEDEEDMEGGAEDSEAADSAEDGSDEEQSKGLKPTAASKSATQREARSTRSGRVVVDSESEEEFEDPADEAEVESEPDSDSESGDESNESDGAGQAKRPRRVAAAAVAKKVTPAPARVKKDTTTTSAEPRTQRTALQEALDPLDVLLRRNFGFSEFRMGQRCVDCLRSITYHCIFYSLFICCRLFCADGRLSDACRARARCWSCRPVPERVSATCSRP